MGTANQIEQELMNYISDHKIRNTHSHHLPEQAMVDYDLDKLINNTYLQWQQVTPGTTAESRNAYLEKTRYKSYFVWLQKAIGELYGISEPITAQNWDQISDRIRKAHQNPDFYMDVLKNKCKYQKVIVDTYWNPEGNRFLVSKKFAQLVQGSDNYFVLATREKLPALPYSVSEIYGFRKSGKFHDAKQKYNEIYHLYGEISEEKNINPKLVITEDSNSGFEFFKEMSRQKGVNCFSAGGKSNIIRQLEQRPNEEGTILVIVDGAAFGSEMKDISECIKTQGNIVLYAPESFEWLLLSTKEIPEVKVETILQTPEEYIDSKEYISWERYFTDLLIESTSKNFIWAYSKKRLTKAYFAPRIVNAVKTIMKLVDWEKSF